MSDKMRWVHKQQKAGRVFPKRPPGRPKKEWQRFLRGLDEQAEARKRGAAARHAEAQKAATEQEEREQVPDNRPPPGLSLEDRRQIIRDASPEEFEKLLASYGISGSPADERRLNPDQQSSAEALLKERENAAAAARKKRQEALPKFDARTASASEVIERMKLRGLVDPSLHVGIREATKPLDPSWKGEKVFDADRFKKVLEGNVDQSIRANLALNARMARDAAKVDEASRKGVRLPAPKPEREAVAPGLWPLVPH